MINLNVLDNLKNAIDRGKPMLFTGAGFSKGCKNCYNKEPLLAGDLANYIGKQGKFDGCDDLAYATGRYIKNELNRRKLITILKDIYTLKEVSPSQERICLIPWKMIYTTNYDNSVELAYANSNYRIDSLDSTQPLHDMETGRISCVHINGQITKINQDCLDTSFKLTHASYLSPDGFRNSPWKEQLRRDLKRCTAFVFVGYSLYDSQIQEIIYQHPEVKDKVFFITKEDISEKDRYTLGEFGTVVPMGIDSFSEWVQAQAPFKPKNNRLESLSLYQLAKQSNAARECDIDNLLMYGNYNPIHVETNIIEEEVPPFIVRRSLLKIIEKNLSDSNVIIVGELANGKSLLLESLQSYLTALGYDVYALIDYDGDLTTDVTTLKENASQSVILIDDYASNFQQTIDLLELGSDNVKIIAAARTADHEYHERDLREKGIDWKEFSVDILDNDEFIEFYDILDSSGVKIDRKYLFSNRHYDKLNSNQKQLSTQLLSVMDSPHIKKKISELVAKLLTSDERKKTVFAICWLAIAGWKIEESTVATLAGCDEIYSPKLRRLPHFKHLFTNGQRVLGTRSSVFLKVVAQEHFNSTFVVDYLLTLAKKLDKIKYQQQRYEPLFKCTMRFSFLKDIFPYDSSKQLFSDYYEYYKNHLPWVKGNPHYWMQYGMAQIQFGDYIQAQKYLDKAYDVIKPDINYDTRAIDTQQARLHFLVGQAEEDRYEAYKCFIDAVELIKRNEMNVYIFKLLPELANFYNSRFNVLTLKNKRKFLFETKGIYSKLLNSEALWVGSYRVLKEFDYAKYKLENVITDAEVCLANQNK